MDLTGLKVMIIDDAATIRRAAEIYLSGPKDKPTGIIISTAVDGFEAIPSILKIVPDIIFMDVMMPRSDGFKICKALKNNKKLKGIKVIMLTSKDGLFDRAKGVEAGSDAYVAKPFQKDSILKVVEEHAPERFKNQ
jgi:twitching motility two-component system response regulator PilG